LYGGALSCAVALSFVPRVLRADLYPLAAGGASAEEMLQRAEELDPAMSWAPDSRLLEKNIKALKSSGARVVHAGEEDYPPSLRSIYDPPICLFVRGRFPAPSVPAVAIVGSRSSAGNSISFSRELARLLAAEGVPVVSGMARGIDSAAHAGCLDGGAGTVAVLGCGVDVCYPRDNQALMRRILESGAVISEYAMGTAPAAYHFPARNRIISGLCKGTVVVEAARGSGALVTAKHAYEEGRIVFAVPGAVWNPLSEGPNALIRDGAVPVRGVHDVLDELFGLAPRGEREKRSPAVRLTRAEHAVLNALDYDLPRHVDSVAGVAGVPAALALTLLLELEMKGLAGELRGKRFLRLSRGC
jgi:DNA processing protein